MGGSPEHSSHNGESLPHSENESEVEAPQPRRSGRATERVDYGQLHRQGRTAMVATLANPLDVPKTWEEAVARPDGQKWQDAINAELSALKARKVWTIQEPPQGRKIIPGRWVFAYKLNPDASIARYKARWVAKGYEQIAGVDFYATYAAVVRSSSWRLLLAIGAKRDRY